MDALKAVKPEKCKRCTISVHISKRIWSLCKCKTEDTSKLSGLQASVYRMHGNLQYSHDVLLQNSYRRRRGLPCLFPNITAVFSIPAHPRHVGRRLQLAVPEPPQRWGGWHPGEDRQHSASAAVLLQTDVYFLIRCRCILTIESMAGSIFTSHASGHTRIHIHTYARMCMILCIHIYTYREMFYVYFCPDYWEYMDHFKT